MFNLLWQIWGRLVSSQHSQDRALARIETALAQLGAQAGLILEALVPGQAVGFVFSADLEGQITEGITKMDLRDDQQVTLTIQPVDKKGKPALVDGVPEWLSSNTDVATVEPSSDGLSALVVAGAPGDSATISVTADADLGAGVTPISGSLVVTVVPGAATSVTIVPGTPADQP
jgi:hypothetical protein